MNRCCVYVGLTVAALFGSAGAWAESAPAGQGPADVVTAFNRAVTDRDMDSLLAHFLDGGVQFNLRPSHGGLQAGPLTSELHARWSMVGPVLFGATTAYTRDAEVVDVHAAGEVATVWVNVTTETVLASNGKSSTEAFTEVYLLVRTDDGWRIAGVADNRQPDDIGIGDG